jgi:hypothetical protein
MARNPASGLPRCSGGGAEWARGAEKGNVVVAAILCKMQDNWKDVECWGGRCRGR